MQVKYPNKYPPTHWDPVHITYPVKKFPETGLSSEAIARGLRSEPEVLKPLKSDCHEVKHHDVDHSVGTDLLGSQSSVDHSVRTDLLRSQSSVDHSVRPDLLRSQSSVDHSVRTDLLRSQSSVDFSYKVPETRIFNKHTSCLNNKFVYPPQRNVSDRVPNIRAHGISEARDKYRTPPLDSKLVTDKEQFRTHRSGFCEPILSKDIEPLFFSYDGFEKYLDPYVTTSRLHHRSPTPGQTNSATVTYYTCSSTPWVRSRKPNTAAWPLSKSKAKSMYDREKFKDEFREIRTHNKMQWVPHTFRTEVRDNFGPKLCQLESRVHSYEEQVRSFHARTIAGLKTRELEEDLCVRRMYSTENAVVGSRKPLCEVFDPYVERNKRLALKT